MREVVFRYNKETGGVLIYTVDDAGALLSADAGETVPAVPEQSVYKSAVRMAGRGMDDHAARFVDDNDVCILEYYVERDVLRLKRRVAGLGQHDREAVTGGTAVILFQYRAAVSDSAVLYEPLGCIARQPHNIMREESVESFAALLCRNDEYIILFHYLNSLSISSSEKSSLAGFAAGADFAAGAWGAAAG